MPPQAQAQPRLRYPLATKLTTQDETARDKGLEGLFL